MLFVRVFSDFALQLPAHLTIDTPIDFMVPAQLDDVLAEHD